MRTHLVWRGELGLVGGDRAVAGGEVVSAVPVEGAAQAVQVALTADGGEQNQRVLRVQRLRRGTEIRADRLFPDSFFQ